MAVITGASKGVGKGIGKAFAGEGKTNCLCGWPDGMGCSGPLLETNQCCDGPE